jgi:hypothetical protein
VKRKAKSPNENKWSVVESTLGRYVRIPKKFIKKIHIDSEGNIVMKSNNNVWFFEIRDIKEEKEIAAVTTVKIDKKFGFKVPLMNYELSLDPEIEEIMFFDDDNGIGCANAAVYAAWSTNKLNKENNNALSFNTFEEMDDLIMKSIRKDKEEELLRSNPKTREGLER